MHPCSLDPRLSSKTRASGYSCPFHNMASDLKVVSIQEDRFSDVIVHLRKNFFSDEPLNKAVKLCKRGEPHAALERHSLATLQQGFSRMAVTDSGVIAGVALNGTVKKSEREKAESRLLETADEKFKAIFTLLYGVNEKVDLFSTYNTEELFECRILSVDENFRGRGLASTLMTDSMETAKQAGFKYDSFYRYSKLTRLVYTPRKSVKILDLKLWQKFRTAK
ncbi:arylalkylamine N-acetyltransferase 1 isoform X3 [Neodiprion lecontei]|uniref:Arylalkylamine N-acetyltransferase 1 isoform X3 n=2 Tax=Neodiprion TaxID=270857 RepID=A0ABM3G2C8_NEOLC|nr:arylalkylamine N-acetyltransferase 1 isoform X3 [Neodiprion pinetum]XP_046594428.1 arylalkylamine N-acetyltransferase 1 isoform X3 [Neodiprion lecontei]